MFLPVRSLAGSAAIVGSPALGAFIVSVFLAHSAFFGPYISKSCASAHMKDFHHLRGKDLPSIHIVFIEHPKFNQASN